MLPALVHEGPTFGYHATSDRKLGSDLESLRSAAHRLRKNVGFAWDLITQLLSKALALRCGPYHAFDFALALSCNPRLESRRVPFNFCAQVATTSQQCAQHLSPDATMIAWLRGFGVVAVKRWNSGLPRTTENERRHGARLP